MNDFLDKNNPKINYASVTSRLQDQINKAQREQMEILATVERAKIEKEMEKQRKHEELIEALKASSGITIENSTGVQIQQNSPNATQTMMNSKSLNYTQTLEILNQIKEYFDMPQFDKTFENNSAYVKTIIEGTIEAVENNADESMIKSSLRTIRDLCIGITGSLIATGIVGLLDKLPL